MDINRITRKLVLSNLTLHYTHHTSPEDGDKTIPDTLTTTDLENRRKTDEPVGRA